MIHKLTDIIICFAFLLFAGVQLNDKDALLWIIIYLIVSLAGALSYLGKLKKRWMRFILIMFCFLLMVYFKKVLNWIDSGYPDFINYPPGLETIGEGIREYLGLCLAAISVTYIYIKTKSPDTSSGDNGIKATLI